MTYSVNNLSSHSSSFRILVIEDDPADARAILTHLHRAGFDCRYSCDSTAVLDAVEESSPHLVLLDVEQPDMDGYALCTGIRRQSKVPIILMCPADQEEDVLRGFQAGADMYVVKPLKPKVLVARVIAQLRRTYRYTGDACQVPVTKTPQGVAAFRQTASTKLSAGWIECDSCRYMGPEQKFHRHAPDNNLVLICPHCSERARVAFAMG